VDAEIARACERIVRGVDAEVDDALLADVVEVGPGGHFLAQRTTRAAARGDEFLVPSLAPRVAYEAWLELGRPSMYATAREQVAAILSGPVMDPLTGSVRAEVDAILAAADRELARDV
jgi:trimethylamine:corrinoid methyltransferase-like protein